MIIKNTISSSNLYKTIIDNVEPVTSSFSHDALGRVTSEIRQDNCIVEYTYHESGRLNTVKRREWADTQFTSQVNSIEYNARGQRNKITYGNDTHTTYEYDKYDFRLINQKTVKTSDTSVVLQENIYKYDPVGNIYSIEDKSRDTVFYSNLAVNPVKTYKYDSLYRVIEVNGWQHSGSMPNLKGDTDLQTGIPSTSDRIAVTTYTETFKYDVNGNVLDKKLVAGANTNTVTYTYQTATNRLASMTEGTSNGSLTYSYSYDENGNITDMGNGTTLSWDYENQLVSSTNGTQTTYYQYTNEGERTRKVSEDLNGYKSKDTIYVSGREYYYEYQNQNEKSFEKETYHVMDDKQRIALIEHEKNSQCLAFW